MDWMDDFYSKTGNWWGKAEAIITERDHARAALLKQICPDAQKVLELGAGYGNTAAAMADAGLNVTANELSDRIKFAEKFEAKQQGSLSFKKGNFYTADVGSGYDAVVYWNGFGIGSDADQRKLLARISKEWLKPTGKALIDVGNPFVRASWAGDREHKDAKPEAGYEHTIDELTDYDPVQNRFTDTWWETGKETEKLTQALRNYTPVDLVLLLESTGLKLDAVYVAGQPLDLKSTHSGNADLLHKEQEYLAVLSIS